MQKDKQERYLELLAGLRLMDDDFFSEALEAFHRETEK